MVCATPPCTAMVKRSVAPSSTLTLCVTSAAAFSSSPRSPMLICALSTPRLAVVSARIAAVSAVRLARWLLIAAFRRLMESSSPVLIGPTKLPISSSHDEERSDSSNRQGSSHLPELLARMRKDFVLMKFLFYWSDANETCGCGMDTQAAELSPQKAQSLFDSPGCCTIPHPAQLHSA